MTRDTTALERLASWPRTALVNEPTPLLRLDRLSHELASSPLYAKMDAETGFALGGNKVRKLEFELADERIEGVTCLITAGGPQSNHCRVTAAFAARRGLRCILVVNGSEPDRPTGNALLQRLFGAEIMTVEDRAARGPGLEEAARRIESEGGTPLVVPIGASTPVGSLGYARAAVELDAQLRALDDQCEETVLFVSTSSCGTMAGLVLGFALLGRPDLHLIGVSADAPAARLRESTMELARSAARLLGATTNVDSVRLTLLDDQVGDGYGISTVMSIRATERFARTEGIVLDPTYTSKAAAGMIDWVERTGLTAAQRAIFLHTGGHPGLLS